MHGMGRLGFCNCSTEGYGDRRVLGLASYWPEQKIVSSRFRERSCLKWIRWEMMGYSLPSFASLRGISTNSLCLASPTSCAQWQRGCRPTTYTSLSPSLSLPRPTHFTHITSHMQSKDTWAIGARRRLRAYITPDMDLRDSVLPVRVLLLPWLCFLFSGSIPFLNRNIYSAILYWIKVIFIL